MNTLHRIEKKAHRSAQNAHRTEKKAHRTEKKSNPIQQKSFSQSIITLKSAFFPTKPTKNQAQHKKNKLVFLIPAPSQIKIYILNSINSTIQCRLVKDIQIIIFLKFEKLAKCYIIL